MELANQFDGWDTFALNQPGLSGASRLYQKTV
jgi:hypothetical protein